MEQDNAETSGGGFAPTPMTDILTPRADKPEPAPTPRTEAKPEPAPAQEASGDKPAQPTAERPRDAAGKFAPKDAQAEAAPPAAKQDAPQSVPVHAVLEERKKRQALERELQELRARVAAPQPAQQQPPQPAPVGNAQPQPMAAPSMPTPPSADLMFSDPDRYNAEMVRYQDARFAIWEQQRQKRELMHAEYRARQEYPDFDEALAELEQYARRTPFAAQEVAALLAEQVDPAGWAYQQGKLLREQRRFEEIVRQHGSLEAYERSLTARSPQPAPTPAPSAAPLPQSLASARSAGPRNLAPAFSGPTPMSAILGRR